MMVEAYLTNDVVLFAKIQEELTKNNIVYKTKTENSGSQNRLTGSFWGRIGERQNREILYYIYTDKDNIELAKKLIADITRK